MTPIDYFKLQAKNLLKDYQTQFPVYDSVIEDYLNDYKPKYFDVGWIVLDFEIDDEKPFTLMNAQHIIAQLAGFYKWTDMLKASDVQLKLGKLLFDNSHKISVLEWNDYIAMNEKDNNVTFDDETRLEIFTLVFANVDGHQSDFIDYRLKATKEQEIDIDEVDVEPLPPVKKKRDIQIKKLPLSDRDRKKFIKTANEVFEMVMWRMEPDNPKLTRGLWNPEVYIDEVLFPELELPISRDYVLDIIDASLVHHVLRLAVQADEMAATLK